MLTTEALRRCSHSHRGGSEEATGWLLPEAEGAGEIPRGYWWAVAPGPDIHGRWSQRFRQGLGRVRLGEAARGGARSTESKSPGQHGRGGDGYSTRGRADRSPGRWGRRFPARRCGRGRCQWKDSCRGRGRSQRGPGFLQQGLRVRPTRPPPPWVGPQQQQPLCSSGGATCSQKILGCLRESQSPGILPMPACASTGLASHAGSRKPSPGAISLPVLPGSMSSPLPLTGPELLGGGASAAARSSASAPGQVQYDPLFGASHAAAGALYL